MNTTCRERLDCSRQIVIPSYKNQIGCLFYHCYHVGTTEFRKREKDMAYNSIGKYTFKPQTQESERANQ